LPLHCLIYCCLIKLTKEFVLFCKTKLSLFFVIFTFFTHYILCCHDFFSSSRINWFSLTDVNYPASILLFFGWQRHIFHSWNSPTSVWLWKSGDFWLLFTHFWQLSNNHVAIYYWSSLNCCVVISQRWHTATIALN